MDLLDEKSLVRILSEPRNALAKQYKKLFELDGVELEFTPEALTAIAKRVTNGIATISFFPVSSITAYLSDYAISPALCFVEIHFDIRKKKSIAAVETAMRQEQRVFVVTQQDSHAEEPKGGEELSMDSLYAYGTVTVVRQLIKLPENVIRVLAVGEYRAQFLFPERKAEAVPGAARQIFQGSSFPSGFLKPRGST